MEKPGIRHTPGSYGTGAPGHVNGLRPGSAKGIGYPEGGSLSSLSGDSSGQHQQHQNHNHPTVGDRALIKVRSSLDGLG